MKRTTLLALLATALISMGGTRAHAQAAAFNVPFDFTLGNQAFSAGTYLVSKAGINAILIRSQDARFHALSTTYSADNKEPYGVCKINFAKYGNKYFLREVLCSRLSMNMKVPRSKREKQTRIQEAQLPHSETVADLRTEAK